MSRERGAVDAHAPDQLAAILHEEAALYEQLLTLLQEEETSLIRGSGRATVDGLARKEALLLEIRIAEVSRHATVKRLTGRSDARLRDLPQASVGELGHARARLTAVLPEVAEASRRVDFLLSRALGRLRDSLALIREAAGLGPWYTPEAQVLTTAPSTLDGRA